MKIQVEYYAHLRDAAGVGREELEVPEGATIEQLARTIAQKHGPRMRQLLLDSQGKPAAHLVFAVGDRQISAGECVVLHDRDQISILPPISGGC